jgi:hypothetical protein
LLTHDDLEHHERHLNARNTLVTLLDHGVIPIINENDAISFTELKFGDNDRLSALVACLLPADALIILTTVDGLIENFGKANPKTISAIENLDDTVEKMAGGTAAKPPSAAWPPNCRPPKWWSVPAFLWSSPPARKKRAGRYPGTARRKARFLLPSPPN